METIQRKVNTKDRLPKITGDYDTDIGTLCFVKDKDSFYENIYNKKEFPEYWYEEINLDNIIAIEKQKYLLLLSHAYQGTDMFDFLAKERYEKALSSIDDDTWFYKDEPILDKQDVIKALKIAAGLKEGE